MLSTTTCQTCGFLSLSDQENGRVEHNTASIVTHHPVPLSSTDHRRLQTDIVDLENDINTIDHQIRRLRTYLSDLRRVRKSKKLQLRHARKASKASIWCLPIEILLDIIALAAGDDNGDIYHGVPWVLSHSCRFFRNIVLTTPEMWSRIYIDDTMRGQDQPFVTQLLQTYLTRSKDSLLFVSINSSNNIDAILECFAPHHSRLYSLELNVCPPGLQSLNELGVENLPKLTALHLSFESADISGLIGGSDVLEPAAIISLYHAVDGRVKAFRHTGALRDVHLYGMIFSFVEIPLKQLTRFAGDIIGISEYLSLFKDAAELVEADLRAYFPDEFAPWDVPANGPLWQTRLTRLSLYADIPGLKFIRLPALQYLRIEETRDTKNKPFTYDVGSDIHVFLQGSECPLETLLLEIPAFPTLISVTDTRSMCKYADDACPFELTLIGARDIYDALTFDSVSCPCSERR
ncbi:hypothetical protein F5146DRAFT_201402 [Armillaria mellea]|nr:hypothetical protein F5146DRAFT_201402 [Armillaria mellea]